MRTAVRASLCCVITAVLHVGGLAGQDLILRRDLPPLPVNACEARGYVFAAGPAPVSEVALDAEGLASEASQAAILGEYQRARDLLAEAAETDPTSSTISYSFGRLLEGGGELEPALAEYCRFLVIAPDAVEVEDVEQRVERIGREVGALGASPARAAFEEGIASFDRADYDQAILDFSRALVEQPEWGQAHYNRAVAYLRSDRDAAGAADLEFDLELAPEAEDRDEIEALLAEIGPVTQYSPQRALVSGLFIPGMGYFYPGRSGAGILALGAAGAAAGFAILQTEVNVQCASPPVNGECPAGQVVSETTKRPLLLPGLAAAAAITVFGAVHASRGARSGTIQLSDGGGLEGPIPFLSSRDAESMLRIEPTRGLDGAGVRAEVEVRF